MSLTTAVSMHYRYADFVRFLDDSSSWEFHLGLIVGLGMIGGLAMRIAQGIGMDTYGPRRVWLLSSALFAVACVGQLAVTTTGPLIYFLRILFQISISGFFGGSIMFISGRAPVARMAEVVGNLGTSGFVGIAIGSFLSDALLGDGPQSRWQLDRVFLLAALLATMALFFSWMATVGHPAPVVRRRRRPFVRVIRRYSPGPILMVGAATGFGLTLPTIFLRAFLKQIDITEIALFFAIYPVVGFIARLSIRRLPERLGIRPMIISGLSILAVGMLLFLPVSREWHLIFPAIMIGIAHAMLFPPVVAGGSAAFPMRYRGLGTTLVLAMFDVGTLFGSPAVGAILVLSASMGLPKYPSMFLAVTAFLTLVAVAYAIATKNHASTRTET
jgi:MFS family permease